MTIETEVLSHIESRDFHTSEYQHAYEKHTGTKISSREAFNILIAICSPSTHPSGSDKSNRFWNKKPPKVIKRNPIGGCR